MIPTFTVKQGLYARTSSGRFVSPMVVMPLIQAAMQRILDLMRKATPTSARNPLSKHPGALRKAWFGRIEVNRPQVGKITLIIGNNDARFKNLFKWLTGGTRPHVIRAIRARVLRFFWIKKGFYMFAKSVNHPGQKPYAPLIRARRQADKEAVKLQRDVRAAIARHLAQQGTR